MSAANYHSFDRERDYTIGFLRACEANLLRLRQASCELSNNWRAPKGIDARLINLRNTELVPIKLFADHMRFLNDDTFRLMALGHPIDAQIQTARDSFNLQITIADLDWDGADDSNPGYQHRLDMEALNQRGLVSGHGPYRRTEGGQIVGEESVYSNEERPNACNRGLAKALRRKATHDGRGCDLLVYARSFYIQTIDSKFREIAKTSVESACRPNFDRVYIFDAPEECFVEL